MTFSGAHDLHSYPLPLRKTCAGTTVCGDVFKSSRYLEQKHCLAACALALCGVMAQAAGKPGASPHERRRMQIYYSGRVQGVGFRYTVRTVAAGFEVVGMVRNLSDGRVELVAEGTRAELEAFRTAIPEAGLAANIRSEEAVWGDPQGHFKGFTIER